MFMENYFKHSKELKDQLVSLFEDKLGSLCNLECGYMEKNLKGGLRMHDKDIEVMYKTFKPGDEIILWCRAVGRGLQLGRL